MFGKIKKIADKMNEEFDEKFKARSKYMYYVRNCTLDDKMILFEAQMGREIVGNIFYMIRELTHNPDYQQYKIYLSIRESRMNAIEKFVSSNPLPGLHIVLRESEEYFRILASAKYLVCDVNLSLVYIKKDGQVLLNTWHGTPLKTLARKLKAGMHTISNTQKNFFVADYLLYPNEFTMQHMIEDYMLENLYSGKILLGGYPRNSAFFNDAGKVEIRQQYKLTDKQVIAYMPTWRGSISQMDTARQMCYISYYLLEMDKQLTDNQVLYVNLHPIARRKIDYKMFKHIKAFPAACETYVFLNAADCLITDYSSVFFDYAVTKRKIILFTYDEEEYMADRGTYFNIHDLPFPQAKTVDELIHEINSPKQYDDTAFLKGFCTYDSADAAKLLCEVFVSDKKNTMIQREIPKNNKENVLIYGGNLDTIGLNTEVFNFLNNTDLSKRNYFITFYSDEGNRNLHQTQLITDNLSYIPIKDVMNLSVMQYLTFAMYRRNLIKSSRLMKKMKDTFQYELHRLYGDIPFSHIIHFTGREYDKILLFSQSNAKKTIFIHDDSMNELQYRKKHHKDMIPYFLSQYDKIAVMDQNMLDKTSALGVNPKEVTIAANFDDLFQDNALQH